MVEANGIDVVFRESTRLVLGENFEVVAIVLIIPGPSEAEMRASNGALPPATTRRYPLRALGGLSLVPFYSRSG